jgi:hypothetical protein
MAVYDDREHFIPLRKSDLIELLVSQPDFPAERREDFRQFCRLVIATYHFEYHKTLEELKNAYAPFDPDADTRLLEAPTARQRQEREEAVFKDLAWLMERANFQRVGEEELLKALEGTSEGGVNMDIDLTVFERYEIYMRGDITQTRHVRRWWRLWRREKKEEPIFQRLVLVMKLRRHKLLARHLDFNKIYLRVYKNIPKMDLETLIPGAQPQMTWWDRGNVGVPVASGVVAVLGKAFSILGLAGILGVLALRGEYLTEAEQKLFTASFALILMGFFGYAFRSYTSYLHLRNKYEKNLSQSLYYQTLDGNAGVLFRLLDEAEEQECREAILAYYFLWRHAGPEGWTGSFLDDTVEEFLEKKAGVKVDFEIDDAIDKLEKLRIVEKLPAVAAEPQRVPEARYRARPLEKALEVLDWTWDNYFKYNNPEPEEPPV